MSSFEGLRLLSIGTALAGMKLAGWGVPNEFAMCQIVMHQVCSVKIAWNGPCLDFSNMVACRKFNKNPSIISQSTEHK